MKQIVRQSVTENSMILKHPLPAIAISKSILLFTRRSSEFTICFIHQEAHWTFSTSLIPDFAGRILYVEHMTVTITVTVTTFVTAHTFYAFRDTRVFYGWCLLIQGYYFVRFKLNYAEKPDLSKCSWHPKRKFGATLFFSVKIKLQFGEKCHIVLLMFQFFGIIVAWLPAIFFLYTNSP